MNEFFATFGVQYGPDVNRQVPHPVLPLLNGRLHWVEVQAPDYGTARDMMFETFNQSWSWLYKRDEFRPEMWPGGCIAILSESGLTPI